MFLTFLHKDIQNLDYFQIKISNNLTYLRLKIPDRYRTYGLFSILILKFVKRLNGNGRGNTSRQIDKLYSAFQKNKNGPLLFTGNINIVPDYSYIHLFKGSLLTDELMEPEKIIKILKLKRLKPAKGC